MILGFSQIGLFSFKNFEIASFILSGFGYKCCFGSFGCLVGLWAVVLGLRKVRILVFEA